MQELAGDALAVMDAAGVDRAHISARVSHGRPDHA